MSSDSPFAVAAAWPVMPLWKACASGGGSIQTGPFGSQLHKSDYVEQGIPSIMPVNIRDNRIDPTDIAMVGEHDVQRLARHRVRVGDIVYSRRGDVRRRALVREGQDGWLCGTGCLRVRPGNGLLESDYLSYYLGHPAVKDWIERHAVGATMPNLNTGILGALPVVVPPVADQRAIAGSLGALDAKIEVNRRMTETLNQMAGAVFRSWFEDYEQAHPAREQSPLGPIPVDWDVAALSDILDVIDCLHSKKPARLESGQPLLQLSNIRDDGLLDMSEVYWISDQDYVLWTSRIEARAGDCVITNVGRSGAVAQIPSGTVAALGRNMTAMRLELDFPFPTFLIELMRSARMRSEIESKLDSGTIMDSLNVRSIPRLRFVRPPAHLIRRFEEMARPLRERMELQLGESSTLAALRDALLPRLLSGETRITDAESAAEEAV